MFDTAHSAATLTGNCGSDPGIACRLVWDLSHGSQAAQLTKVYLAGPINLTLRVVFVIALALAIRTALLRLIKRATERAAEASLPRLRHPHPGGRRQPWRRSARQEQAEEEAALAAEEGTAEPVSAELTEHALIAERRHQRVRALGSILGNAATIAIFGIAAVIVVGDLGINLAPLLASAGVVGIAVGFGAQNLVRDYVSGIFMLLEDQYGVGDVITVGDATGTVETVNLRTTRLRDVNGVVWHIRNGTIDKVGNETQGWARAVIDFPVHYEAELPQVRDVIERATGKMWHEAKWRKVMLEQPEVWGAQEITSEEVTMRVVARTAPLRQWEVEREMRSRIKAALDAAGIHPPTETLALVPAAARPSRTARRKGEHGS